MVKIIFSFKVLVIGTRHTRDLAQARNAFGISSLNNQTERRELRQEAAGQKRDCWYVLRVLIIDLFHPARKTKRFEQPGK